MSEVVSKLGQDGKNSRNGSEGPVMSKKEKVKETPEFHLPRFLTEAAMRPAT